MHNAMEKYVEMVLNLLAFLTPSPLENSACTSENWYDPLRYHTLTPLSRVPFEKLIVTHPVKILCRTRRFTAVRITVLCDMKACSLAEIY
jgi:hypothetical protein